MLQPAKPPCTMDSLQSFLQWLQEFVQPASKKEETEIMKKRSVTRTLSLLLLALCMVLDVYKRQALTLANVQYAAGDELSHLPFADVEPGMRITHADVDISYDVKYKTLEYDETIIKDDSEYEDYKKVEVEGANGKKQVTYRVTIKAVSYTHLDVYKRQH